jgi:hypothetical protein
MKWTKMVMYSITNLNGITVKKRHIHIKIQIIKHSNYNLYIIYNGSKKSQKKH